MQRIATPPRPDWPKLVEAQGLTFHSIDGVPYWDESAYYLFESREVDAIEAATQQLDRMCLEAVEHVIREGRLGDVGVPPEFHRWVAQSWERDEHTIYGRFDLSFDGNGPPKLLEYNADTPTSLLEAAVIQWTWAEALRAAVDDRMLRQFDQFNSIHERLIEAWRRVAGELGTDIAFASLADTVEDNMTATYLRDTAIQGGMRTESLAIEQVGWNAGRRTFTDLRERPIPILFKLYPWEWMLGEAFGRHLPEAPTHWLEPPWKMVLSSKAILPILCELFPDSPYLLPAGFEPTGPVVRRQADPLARGGQHHDRPERRRSSPRPTAPTATAPGSTSNTTRLPNFDGNFPVIGSLDRQRPCLRHRDSRRQRPDHPEHQPVSSPPVPQVRHDQAPRLPDQLSARRPRRPALRPLDRPLRACRATCPSAQQGTARRPWPTTNSRSPR